MKTRKMPQLARTLKERFDYDVTALPNWTDNTMPDVIPDLIANSDFLSKLTLEEGVKGTLEIALLSADVELKAKTGCTPSPDGSVIFTKKDLTTKQLYAGIEFCNETLNKKMTQILNVLGLKMQNGKLPADLETILIAYLTRLLQRKAQRLVVSGDTTSLDTELNIFNGLRKLMQTDPDVNVYTTPYIAINETNGYKIAFGFFKTIPTELFDAGVAVEIYTGRTEALAIIEDWNNESQFNQIDVPEQTTSFSFMLPRTGVRIVTLPELDGTGEMYFMPLSLTFLGTDLESDMSFDVKYDEYNDKLKVEASFRLGTQIVWGQYFGRLEYTAS